MSIPASKKLRVERLLNCAANLLLRGPNVAQIYGIAAPVYTKRLVYHINIHCSRERISDNKWRRREIAHLCKRINAALKVSVAAQDCGDCKIVFLNGIGYRFR